MKKQYSVLGVGEMILAFSVFKTFNNNPAMFNPYLPKFMVNWETRNILLSVFEAFWNWYLLFPLARCVPWALAYTYYHQISQFLKFHHWLFCLISWLVYLVYLMGKKGLLVCVALNLVSGLGQNFLVNSTPGPAERFHIMGECTYLERINCPMIKMNPPKIGGDKSPLSPYAPPGRTLCYVVLCTIYTLYIVLVLSWNS